MEICRYHHVVVSLKAGFRVALLHQPDSTRSAEDSTAQRRTLAVLSCAESTPAEECRPTRSRWLLISCRSRQRREGAGAPNDKEAPVRNGFLVKRDRGASQSLP